MRFVGVATLARDFQSTADTCRAGLLLCMEHEVWLLASDALLRPRLVPLPSSSVAWPERRADRESPSKTSEKREKRTLKRRLTPTADGDDEPDERKQK